MRKRRASGRPSASARAGASLASQGSLERTVRLARVDRDPPRKRAPSIARRVRLDQLLVQRELAPSRERAQALILAGAVRVRGDRADRAAEPVPDDVEIVIEDRKSVG